MRELRVLKMILYFLAFSAVAGLLYVAFTIQLRHTRPRKALLPLHIQTHLRRVLFRSTRHLPPIEKRTQCVICNKTFASRNQLIPHARRHRSSVVLPPQTYNSQFYTKGRYGRNRALFRLGTGDTVVLFDLFTFPVQEPISALKSTLSTCLPFTWRESRVVETFNPMYKGRLLGLYNLGSPFMVTLQAPGCNHEECNCPYERIYRVEIPKNALLLIGKNTLKRFTVGCAFPILALEFHMS